MPTKWIIGLIIIFCCDFVLAASCSKDEILIVESNSPRYRAGSCLKISKIETSKFLNQGECLVVKPYEKSARKICGPEGNLIGFIERLIERLIRKRSYYNSNCNIWDIDISRNEEAFCFESSKELSLCRTNANYSEYLVIEDNASKKLYKGIWQDGETHFLWPQDHFPIYDGAIYQLKISDDNIRKTIVFYKVPKTVSGNKETSWMLNKGCYRQANIRVPVMKR